MDKWIKEIRDILIAIMLSFLLYKGLGFALSTDYPVLVVVSCSMVPVLERGDVIVVKGTTWEEIIANEKWRDPNSTIIVYYEPFHRKLIVHRAYKKVIEKNERYIIAWGDNNSEPDPWLIPESNIEGKVVFRIPYVGYPRLWLGYILGEDVEGCKKRIEVISYE